MGLTVVKEPSAYEAAVELAGRYDDEVMIERFVPGRELTVGVLEGQALAVGEIIPRHEIFDYECKYTPGMSEEIFPADLPAPVARECQRLAVAGARGAEAGRLLAGRFSLDTGRGSLLFRSKYAARHDGDQPPSPGRPGGGHRVPRPVRTDLSNRPAGPPEGTVVSVWGLRVRGGSMNLAPSSRITPWVARLIIANAVVLLLMRTIFTLAGAAGRWQFSPADALTRALDLLQLHVRPRRAAASARQHADAVRVRHGGGKPDGQPDLHPLLPVCGVGAAVFSLALSGIMSGGPLRRAPPARCSAWPWPSRCSGPTPS